MQRDASANKVKQVNIIKYLKGANNLASLIIIFPNHSLTDIHVCMKFRYLKCDMVFEYVRVYNY